MMSGSSSTIMTSDSPTLPHVRSLPSRRSQPWIIDFAAGMEAPRSYLKVQHHPALQLPRQPERLFER